jgi:cytochrome c oxidase subunit 1
MTVAGPVFLAIIGMSTYMYATLSGKKIFLPRVNVIIPYLWMIGVLIFSSGLMWGGLIGEPRRTNLGLTYLNPTSELYHPAWVPTTTLALFGGIIMFTAGLLYFVVFFGTIFRKSKKAGVLDFPVSEVYHDEPRIALLDKFKPWLVAMAIILMLAYIPALINVNNNTGPKAPMYTPDNPVPVQTMIPEK